LRIGVAIWGGFLDSDGWFILTEGRDILTSGIEYTNTHTVFPNLSIVVQQWGWDVIVYTIYRVLGYAGLFILSVGEAALVIALMYKLGTKMGGDKPLVLLLSILASMFLMDYFTVRPNAITVALLLAQLIVTEEYRKRGDRKILLLLVLFTFLEMNLHGSMWVLHFLFLLPYVFPSFSLPLMNVQKREYKVKPMLGVAVLMTVVLFLNPYGVDGVMYLFNSYGSTLNQLGISELEHIKIFSLNSIMATCSVIGFVLFAFVMKIPLRAETIYLWGGNLIMGVMNYRNFHFVILSLFVLFSSVLPYISLDLPKFHKFVNHQPLPLFLLFACILAFGVGQPVYKYIGQPLIQDTESEPLVAVEYLKENAEEGARVYTEFNTGAYLEWNNYTIYIDARPELYLKSVNKEYDYLLDTVYYKDYTEDDYEALKDYDFDYWIIPYNSDISIYAAYDESLEYVAEGNNYRLYKTIK
jgi:hypothetical protein